MLAKILFYLKILTLKLSFFCQKIFRDYVKPFLKYEFRHNLLFFVSCLYFLFMPHIVNKYLQKFVWSYYSYILALSKAQRDVYFFMSCLVCFFSCLLYFHIYIIRFKFVLLILFFCFFVFYIGGGLLSAYIYYQQLKTEKPLLFLDCHPLLKNVLFIYEFLFNSQNGIVSKFISHKVYWYIYNIHPLISFFFKFRITNFRFLCYSFVSWINIVIFLTVVPSFIGEGLDASYYFSSFWFFCLSEAHKAKIMKFCQNFVYSNCFIFFSFYFLVFLEPFVWFLTWLFDLNLQAQNRPENFYRGWRFYLKKLISFVLFFMFSFYTSVFFKSVFSHKIISVWGFTLSVPFFIFFSGVYLLSLVCIFVIAYRQIKQANRELKKIILLNYIGLIIKNSTIQFIFVLMMEFFVYIFPAYSFSLPLKLSLGCFFVLCVWAFWCAWELTKIKKNTGTLLSSQAKVWVCVRLLFYIFWYSLLTFGLLCSGLVIWVYIADPQVIKFGSEVFGFRMEKLPACSVDFTSTPTHIDRSANSLGMLFGICMLTSGVRACAQQSLFSNHQVDLPIPSNPNYPPLFMRKPVVLPVRSAGDVCNKSSVVFQNKIVPELEYQLKTENLQDLRLKSTIQLASVKKAEFWMVYHELCVLPRWSWCLYNKFFTPFSVKHRCMTKVHNIVFDNEPFWSRNSSEDKINCYNLGYEIYNNRLHVFNHPAFTAFLFNPFYPQIRPIISAYNQYQARCVEMLELAHRLVLPTFRKKYGQLHDVEQFLKKVDSGIQTDICRNFMRDVWYPFILPYRSTRKADEYLFEQRLNSLWRTLYSEGRITCREYFMRMTHKKNSFPANPEYHGPFVPKTVRVFLERNPRPVRPFLDRQDVFFFERPTLSETNSHNLFKNLAAIVVG